MFLEFENLRIRNAECDDAQQLAAWWNDGKVMAHAGFPFGLNESVEEIQESIKANSDDTFRCLIIEAAQQAIGEMCYRNLGNHIVSIGIKICDFSYQNKGLGRKLLSMLIQELFDMGYHKIVLDTDLENERAQHVYESLGFKKLRVNINSWKDQLGEYRSSVDYELTAETFNDYTKK